jgi:hypothetical protein
VAELAGAIIAETAPEQLEYFALVDPGGDGAHLARRPRAWPGSTVGSGIVNVLTSDIIYPVLAGVCTQLLGEAVVAGRRRWGRRRGPAIDGDTRLPISGDAGFVAEFRSAFIASCTAMKVPETLATPLADAAVGIIVRMASRPGTGPEPE